MVFGWFVEISLGLLWFLVGFSWDLDGFGCWDSLGLGG